RGRIVRLVAVGGVLGRSGWGRQDPRIRLGSLALVPGFLDVRHGDLPPASGFGRPCSVLQGRPSEYSGAVPAAQPGAAGDRTQPAGSRTMTGMSRMPLVFSSYSANPWNRSFCVVQMRSRSSPFASRATASNESVPTSTWTFGFASRLWYQSGFVGEPPLDAK